ncbi:MAG: glycosyltransferase [bacterium]
MASKFRLLMTTDVKSEIWDYSLTLSRAILKYINADILMVSMGGKPTERQVEQSKDLNIKFQFTDFSPDFFIDNKSDDDISEIKTVFNSSIKEFDPHIVHLNHGYPNFDFNKPCVFACHENLLNKKIWNSNINRYSPLHENLFNYKQIINESFKKSDIITISSRFFAESIIKTYNFTKGIRIIYNGIDYKPYSGMPEIPTLLAFANLSDRNKNMNLILNIAYKLPDNIKIKVIGDAQPDRKLPKNIEFINNLSNFELQEVYKNSSIYLALSSDELNGLSSIQAAYSGCAILANNIPACKELWGDSAQIFEKDNINSLIRCINNLVENPNVLEVTSKNCQAKALSVFNSKRMAYEYINLYKNVLKKHQTSDKVSQENQKSRLSF